MKEIAIALIGLLVFFGVQFVVDSGNPCSQFSKEPQRCGQGRD